MTKEPNDLFDFKTRTGLPGTFSLDYLRQYYPPERGVSADEKLISEFLYSLSKKLPQLKNGIEIGCGPTVHHALLLQSLVEHLDMADYLDENLAQVDSWVNQRDKAWNWNVFTHFALSLEGTRADENAVRAKEMQTRHCIRNLKVVNLLEQTPLEKDISSYDLVATFYCTEEIALTVTRWKEIVGKVINLVRPGGYFIMSCLENTDFYHIKGADGSIRTLPCARITADAVVDVLNARNCDSNKVEIRSARTPEQAAEGIPGIFLVCAQIP